MDAMRTQTRVASPRASDRAVRWLEERGVVRVFGIPGGAAAPLFDALVDSSIEVVMCQHEAMAVYLAYGEARATGRPGVVLVTSGPGVLNTVTSVAAAYQDEVPLLILAGEVRTDWAGRGALQDGGVGGLDLASMFRPVVRFQDALEQPERVEALLGRAWDATLAHPRGPALLRLPVDLTATPVPTVPEWRSTVVPRLVDAEPLRRAAQLLASARRPVIFAGIGARTAGVGEWLERVAHRLRIPIVTDVEGKGVVSEHDPLSLGLFGVGAWPAAMRYLDEGVDVMLAVGARFDDTTTAGYSPLLRPSSALIQLDHDPRRLQRAWPADIAVAGDLRESLDTLLAAAPRPSVATVAERDAAVRRARGGVEAVIDPLGEAPFDPRSVITLLTAAFGSGTVFTSDIGNHLLFASRYLQIGPGGEFHVSNGLGGMGSGIGVAMGLAATWRDQRRVVGICGDGGLLMVGNELATCARYRIPVVLAVLDNRELGMVEHGMQNLYGRSAFAGVPDVDLCAWARALGARVVDVTGEADVRAVAESTIEGPVVLRFPIDGQLRASNPRLNGFQVGAARG